MANGIGNGERLMTNGVGIGICERLMANGVGIGRCFVVKKKNIYM
jgi:hypothetical protein